MSDFRRRAHALVDRLADELESSRRGEGKPVDYRDPEDLYAYWRDFDGSPDEAFAGVLAQSTRVHHPGYVGHQVAVPHDDAILASWVSDFVNNGSAVYEMGMAGNAIERVVADDLCGAFGFPAAAAESLCVLVSDQAHYCIERAAYILGWGPEGVVSLRTGPDFKVVVEAQRRGRRPIAVVGMACSTSTGAYDDLAMLAAFAKTEGLWFHVDGAHGAVARFAAAESHRVAGIELADSITLDAHKMMRTPALTTVLLYARGEDSYRTFASHADYLWGGAATGEWFHSGQRTVECTRMLMGLRVFALLRGEGLVGIGAYVAGRCAVARAFAGEVRAREGWELAVAPESNIVCFRPVPVGVTEPGALDAVNVALRERLLRDGRWYVVSTRLRGAYYLRVTVMNAGTGLGELIGLLELAKLRKRVQRLDDPVATTATARPAGADFA